jgi:hypothetical protein
MDGAESARSRPGASPHDAGERKASPPPGRNEKPRDERGFLLGPGTKYSVSVWGTSIAARRRRKAERAPSDSEEEAQYFGHGLVDLPPIPSFPPILDAPTQYGETSSMSNESKRYSDREAALIIQAALDSEEKERIEDSGGLLLSEIEEIARETGISAEHIRLAVDKIVARRKPSTARLWLGSETSFKSVEIVPHELTQEEMERLDQALPALTNVSEPSVVSGGTLTWKRSILKSFLDGFPLRLSVKSAKNGTAIEASASLNSMASLLFAASGGVGVVVGLKLSIAAMLLIGIGNIGLPLSALFLSLGGFIGLGGFWLLARLAFRSFVKRSRERVAAIVDKIKRSIQPL